MVPIPDVLIGNAYFNLFLRIGNLGLKKILKKFYPRSAVLESPALNCLLRPRAIVYMFIS